MPGPGNNTTCNHTEPCRQPFLEVAASPSTTIDDVFAIVSTLDTTRFESSETVDGVARDTRYDVLVDCKKAIVLSGGFYGTVNVFNAIQPYVLLPLRAWKCVNSGTASRTDIARIDKLIDAVHTGPYLRSIARAARGL